MTEPSLHKCRAKSQCGQMRSTTGAVHNMDGGEQQYFRRNVTPVIQRSNDADDELLAVPAVDEF